MELQLTPAEEKLVEAAASGKVASYLVGRDETDDPAKGDQWGPERTVRAEVVRALVSSKEAKCPVHAKGVSILGARISGALDLQAAEVVCPLALERCYLDETLTLAYASVPSILLRGSHVPRVAGDGLTVRGNVFLDGGFTAEGGVRLVRAEIGAQLNCSGGRFGNPSGWALIADGVRVKGDVFLDQGFTAEGGVSLVRAEIDGQLACSGGRFEGPTGLALQAYGLRAADVYLNMGFTPKGEVRLRQAEISGALECRGWRRDVSGDSSATSLSLEYARARELRDEEASWPEPGKLLLDGFQYGGIAAESPREFRSRLRWLELIPGGAFSTQPYEQLAKVLRSMGYERDSRRVLVEKNRAVRAKGNLGAPGWAANWLFQRTVGYGYCAWYAALWAAAIVFLGAWIFHCAGNSGVMAPRRTPGASGGPGAAVVGAPPPAGGCPRFHAALYSADVFLPTGGLFQKSDCILQARQGRKARDWGFYGYECWYLFEGLSGWVLTLLVAGALTGLIRKGEGAAR
jgi:hypothetical protein